MNSSLALASDFIERAANPVFGLDVNEEYALRWEVMRQTADPVPNLRINELKPEDIEVLSPEGWFWLGSSLTANDPELPTALVEALFQSTADEVYRLKVADMSLRHPRLSLRYADARLALREMPSSWARDRLQRLLSETEVGPDGLSEMTLILLQVANKPSLLLLRGLRRNRQSLVDGVIERLPGVGSDVAGVVQRLGLED
jgi:hypothetical protein